MHVLPHLHARLLERQGSLLYLLKGLLLLLEVMLLLLLVLLLERRLLLVRASTVGQLNILLLLLLSIVSLAAVLLLVCIRWLLVCHLLTSAKVPLVPNLLVHSCIAVLSGEAGRFQVRHSRC